MKEEEEAESRRKKVADRKERESTGLFADALLTLVMFFSDLSPDQIGM